MIGNGTVTLDDYVVAQDVLVQIKSDISNTGWSGTIYISAGKLIDGEPPWMHDRFGLQVEGGPSGKFLVTTCHPLRSAVFLEIRGSGPLEQFQGGATN